MGTLIASCEVSIEFPEWRLSLSWTPTTTASRFLEIKIQASFGLIELKWTQPSGSGFLGCSGTIM